MVMRLGRCILIYGSYFYICEVGIEVSPIIFGSGRSDRRQTAYSRLPVSFLICALAFTIFPALTVLQHQNHQSVSCRSNFHISLHQPPLAAHSIVIATINLN